GPDRIEISSDGVARVVEVEDLAGLLVFDDGGRYVVRRDGWGIHVLPSAWRHGAAAVAAVDAVVPAFQHLPQPARPDAAHARMRFAPRWWRGLGRALDSAAGLRITLTLL